MIDQFEFDLMPISIKMQMRTIRKVGFFLVGCLFTLYITVSLLGVFRNMFTAVTFFLMLLLVIVPVLLPGLRYDKISQSRIYFGADYIRIIDKKGKCWRAVEYSTISDVRTEYISGFFYGENKDMFRNKYICIFLNGLTDIPPVPFARLFTENDFILFAYHPKIPVDREKVLLPSMSKDNSD